MILSVIARGSCSLRSLGRRHVIVVIVVKEEVNVVVIVVVLLLLLCHLVILVLLLLLGALGWTPIRRPLVTGGIVGSGALHPLILLGGRVITGKLEGGYPTWL